MERELRTRLGSVGILLVVLASGVVLGVAWERRGASVGAEAAESEVRGGDEDEDRDRRGDDDRRDRRRIVDRVELRPVQEDRVDSIVEIHKERMKALQREFREEYNPRYWSLVQETREAIRTVLDADQEARYDSLLAEHDRKRRDDDRQKRRDEDDPREERDRGDGGHEQRDGSRDRGAGSGR